MIFCLQYLTIKVCNDKPLSINFAVLNFGISNRVQQQTKKTKYKRQTKKKRIMESSIRKILGKVRAWYGEYRKYRRGKQLVRVKELAIRRSREDIQIMEYRGKMYISYRGVPIVSDEDLGAPWSVVLERSRKVYEEWLIEREMEK